MKAHAYEKIQVTQKVKFVLGKVENFLNKGKNTGI